PECARRAPGPPLERAMEGGRVGISHRVRGRLDRSLLLRDQALGHGRQRPLDNRAVGLALFSAPPAERAPAESEAACDGLHVIAIGGRRYEHVLAHPFAVGRLALLSRTAPIVGPLRRR